LAGGVARVAVRLLLRQQGSMRLGLFGLAPLFSLRFETRRFGGGLGREFGLPRAFLVLLPLQRLALRLALVARRHDGFALAPLLDPLGGFAPVRLLEFLQQGLLGAIGVADAVLMTGIETLAHENRCTPSFGNAARTAVGSPCERRCRC